MVADSRTPPRKNVVERGLRDLITVKHRPRANTPWRMQAEAEEDLAMLRDKKRDIMHAVPTAEVARPRKRQHRLPTKPCWSITVAPQEDNWPVIGRPR